MGHYSNPTENAAIGAVDKELRRMQKWSEQIRRRHRNNTLTPQELARANKAFVGIYRRFLLEALADDSKAASQEQPSEMPSYNRNVIFQKQAK